MFNTISRLFTRIYRKTNNSNAVTAIRETYNIDGKTVAVEYEPSSTFGGLDLIVDTGDGRPASRINVAGSDHIHEAVEKLVHGASFIAAESAVQYLLEIAKYSEIPYLAFRSFYYHRWLADYEDTEIARQLEKYRATPEVTIKCGLALAQQLLTDQPDMADWVARSTAQLANEQNLVEKSCYAWQLAASANEQLGDADAADECYAHALEYTDSCDVGRLQASCHMSVGITATILLGDTEFQTDSTERNLYIRIAEAREHLKIARKAYCALSDESINWELASIDLDLARLRDLSGDHRGALGALTALEGSDRWVADPKLEATVVQYRLAALSKESMRDKTAHAKYRAELELAHTKFGIEGIENHMPAHRAVPYLMLLAEAQHQDGRYDLEQRALLAAANIVDMANARLLRPPDPGHKQGGFMTIDVVSRLLRHSVAMSCTPRPENAIDVPKDKFLTRADHVKGLNLRRDLMVQQIQDRGVSPLISNMLRDARDHFVRGHYDRRIMVADYAYHTRRNMLLEDRIMPTEQIGLLLVAQPDTRIVSFYTSDRTYVHVVQKGPDPGSFHVDLVELDVRLAEVERASVYLQTYFSGRGGMYGPIDPRYPHRHDDKFLNGVRHLETKLLRLLPLIEDAKALILIPHRAWHNIALHSLLLPALWQRDRNPAITYIPSLGLLWALQSRAGWRLQKSNMSREAPVALHAAPGRDEEMCQFRNAYNTIEAVMAASSRPYYGHFEASPRDVLDFREERYCLHLLAHGRFRAGGEALRSALVMRKNSAEAELTAYDVLASGGSSNHVTLQACSLGSSVPARGDELWGFTRALLAIGTDTVLAPVWNIDLASSTQLLRDFYDRWIEKKEPKAIAFAEAQRAMALESSNSAWSHPYHWAAFQMTGLTKEIP